MPTKAAFVVVMATLLLKLKGRAGRGRAAAAAGKRWSKTPRGAEMPGHEMPGNARKHSLELHSLDLQMHATVMPATSCQSWSPGRLQAAAGFEWRVEERSWCQACSPRRVGSAVNMELPSLTFETLDSPATVRSLQFWQGKSSAVSTQSGNRTAAVIKILLDNVGSSFRKVKRIVHSDLFADAMRDR